jgi:hypothetical protein
MDESTINIDVDVWANYRRRLPEIRDQLRALGFRGLYLTGVDKILLDRHDIIPFIGFRLYHTAEDAARNYHRNTIVTAVRLESGEVFAGPLFPEELQQKVNGPPLPPPEPGYTAMQFTFDLRSLIADFPFRQGTFVTTILLEDQCSNRIITRLSPGLATEEDPAVVEFIRKNREPPPPPSAIFPPLPTFRKAAISPNYAATPQSPSLPENLGITITIDDVISAKPRRPCILRGSFSLPIERRFMVNNSTDSIGDPRATAVVPVNLVICGDVHPGPYVLSLHIPTYTPIQPGAEHAIVTGYFEIDLFTLEYMPQLLEKYYVWALAGEHISAPCVFTIISEP